SCSGMRRSRRHGSTRTRRRSDSRRCTSRRIRARSFAVQPGVVMKTWVTSVLAVFAVLACGPSSPAPEGNGQDQFWASLQALCGSAFAGAVVEVPPGDTTFAAKDLVMHVRYCSDDATHISFNAGDDRSRTWVLTRTDEGLRLKHDHRHEDGSEDALTQYGGDTRGDGAVETPPPSWGHEAAH